MVVLTRAKKRRLEGEKGGAGGDLVSLLPDAILGEIIAMLPTADGARTQLLSRRWRPLWRSSPLNLKALVVAGSDRDAESPDFVTRLLSAHGAPARRFSLTWHGCDDGLFLTVDPWLRLSLLGGLHELELSYQAFGPQGPRSSPPLPLSAFRCSATLRVLTICSHLAFIQFPAVETATTLHFPCLKQLTLKQVDISESSLNGILSRCPVLESLLL